MPTIWKISHGKNNFSREERSDYLNSQLVVAHGSIKKKQGEAFTERMNPGDYFFLCHENDEGLVVLGRIKSDAVESNKGKGWFERSYEVIRKLDAPIQYQGIERGWTPNYNSTVKEVKPNELKLFEEDILQKYFDLTLAELDSDFAPPQEARTAPSKLSEATSQMIGLNTIY